ncbi:MAG: hypothetical protein QG640_247 [Patescibacteria group bacterium]|nr:hypothetical protein [Patescibacteria group bacterium]
MIAALKERKNGGKVADVYGITQPGREQPINNWESPTVQSVQFFEKDGGATVSTALAASIALIEVHTRFGNAVWVRGGNEKLLADDRWSQHFRIRRLQIFSS